MAYRAVRKVRVGSRCQQVGGWRLERPVPTCLSTGSRGSRPVRLRTCVFPGLARVPARDTGSIPAPRRCDCLLEVFGLVPRLELCRYEIARSESAVALAHRYLDEICPAGPDAAGRYPVVFMHYEGNTSAGQKNLSHELVRQVCEVVLAAGLTPVILDWDHRSPLPDTMRIHNPDADHYLWNGRGTGDAEVLAALIDCGRLMIGVDSSPLHVAGATSTPTVGVWTAHQQ